MLKYSRMALPSVSSYLKILQNFNKEFKKPTGPRCIMGTGEGKVFTARHSARRGPYPTSVQRGDLLRSVLNIKNGVEIKSHCYIDSVGQI